MSCHCVRRDEPMLIYNVWTHAYGISGAGANARPASA